MQRRALMRFMLAGIVAVTALCSSSGCSRIRAAERLVERWEKAYNSHDLPGFSALYSQEGSFFVPGTIAEAKSSAQVRRFMDAVWRQTKDGQIKVVGAVIVDGDRVAFRWELTGTPPMSARKVLYGATFLRLEQGQIKEEFMFHS